MKRRVWALITGQIRSELYFRVLLIKLCDLRARGIVEEVVYSTWDDEIDKYPGLREQLKELAILLVETPIPDSKIESKFNQMSYEYQRTSLYKGISSIPMDCFVIKLRTDLNIYVGEMFKFLSEERDGEKLTVKEFGKFPHMYDRKIAMQVFNTNHLMFCNDRFFMGTRNDIKKFCNPIANQKTRKFPILVDNELLNGYAYHFFPLLNESWNILPIEFYNSLAQYCKGCKEENLILPRMVHRIYAIICVYIYTHIHLLNWTISENQDAPFELIELFRAAPLSNVRINKIVTGNLVPSLCSEIFKDELRKISLDLPEIHGYTYEEYEELKKFTCEKLRNPSLIARYPFHHNLYVDGIDKKTASRILMNKYHDERFVEQITGYVDDGFDGFGRSIYHRMNFDGIDKKLYVEALRAAVHDYDRKSIAEYARLVCEEPEFFCLSTWDKALKNMIVMTNVQIIDESSLIAVYYFVQLYQNRVEYNMDVDRFSGSLNVLVDRISEKLLSKSVDSNPVRSSKEFLNLLVNRLEKVSNFLDRDNLEIFKALLCIAPSQIPSLHKIIEILKRTGQTDLLAKIEKAYQGNGFIEGDLAVPSDLEKLINEDDMEAVFTKVTEVKGLTSTKALLYYFWEKQVNAIEYKISTKVVGKIKAAIEILASNLKRRPFLVKASRFFEDNELNILRDDIVDSEDYAVLLEMLYRKNLLNRNAKSAQEMCFGDRWRKMLYYAFLRMERDERISFFSMKSENTLWFYYTPYLAHDRCSDFPVSVGENGRTWPMADRKNISAFSAFIRLIDEDLFLSIEFSSQDRVNAKALVEKVGFEEKNSLHLIYRLLTKRIPMRGDAGISTAVNQAMDEFCRIGEKVVDVLAIV